MPVFFFIKIKKVGIVSNLKTYQQRRAKKTMPLMSMLVQRYIHSRTIPEHLPTHFHLLRTVVNTLIYTFY